MCVYNNRLYVSIAGAFKKPQLIFYDGVSWQVGPDYGAIGDESAMRMVTHKGRLYLSSYYNKKIFSYDGAIVVTEYTIPFGIGFGQVVSFFEYKGKLYANYQADIAGDTRYGIAVREPYNYFDDVSLSLVTVTFSSDPAVSTDTDYEYYTSKDGADEDFSRFKRYRLHFEQAKSALYRQKYVGPGPNDWVNDGPAPLCQNVSRLTITNTNQESFDVELALDQAVGMTGTMLKYSTRSKFTPAVP